MAVAELLTALWSPAAAKLDFALEDSAPGVAALRKLSATPPPPNPLPALAQAACRAAEAAKAAAGGEAGGAARPPLAGSEDMVDGGVVQVTAADVAAGRARLRHVLLPLPGYRVAWGSGGGAKAVAEAALAEAGLRLDDLRGEERFAKLPGGYRKLLVEAGDLECAEEAGDASACACGGAGAGECACVKLEFSLPKGSFATSVVRGLCACDG